MISVEVSRVTLEAGIRAFKARRNWPADFHASFYARQAKRLAGGLTEKWWSETVPDLRYWLATRPLSNAVLRSRGLAALPRLKAAYRELPPAGTDFGDANWRALSQLFEAACSIKPTLRPSSVFPSKLCHFIRAEQYVVVDRGVVGFAGPYQGWWEKCAEAWRVARPIHEELRRVLQEAAGAALPPTYPFGTKITELCAIGTRGLQNSRRATRNEVEKDGRQSD